MTRDWKECFPSHQSRVTFLVRNAKCVMVAASPRVALIPIGIHSKMAFYIARRMLTTNRVMFHVKRYAKVIILLSSISNIER